MLVDSEGMSYYIMSLIKSLLKITDCFYMETFGHYSCHKGTWEQRKQKITTFSFSVNLIRGKHELANVQKSNTMERLANP